MTFFYDSYFETLLPFKGMSRFIKNLLSCIPDAQIVPLLPRGLSRANKPTQFSFGFRNYLLWEQLSLYRFYKKQDNNKTHFIFPYNTAPVLLNRAVNTTVIVHDLIFLESTKRVPLSMNFRQIIGRIYRMLTVPVGVKKATAIITVSEYSKNQLINRLNVDSDKIFVIYNSVNPLFFQKCLPKLSIKKKFILTVSGDASNKNFIRLLKAYLTLTKEDQQEYSLFAVGSYSDKFKKDVFQRCKQSGDYGEVKFFSHISDEDLRDLYAQASVFMFPSIEEGFGIPLIEAMAQGCVVATSDTSVMPEICGNAAIYFNPFSIDSIGHVLTKVIHDKDNNVEYRGNNCNQLEKFSSENQAAQITEWLNYIKKCQENL